MRQRTSIIFLIVLAVVTLINSAALYINYQKDNKTVVIDIVRVVNEFKLKKDLEDRVSLTLNKMSSDLDSLGAVHKTLVNTHAPEEQIRQVFASIDTLRHRAQRAYEISNRNINDQVWQRLNSLLNEYGDKYSYELVIGANGMGTVLFNKKYLDKTEELIKFINQKYEMGH